MTDEAKQIDNAQQLAIAVRAQDNCVAAGRTIWYDRWGTLIDEIMETAPSGAGIDCGTRLDIGRTMPDYDKPLKRLSFTTEYHHMTEDGCYDGWTQHNIDVYPDFGGYDIRVSGVNRNNIKDYLHDVYYEWVAAPCAAKLSI